MRNFFNARNVFQIDGNLGVTAGIAECLLQSHIALHFLPALPASWENGYVKGLMARGGYEIDLYWHDNQLTKATIKPHFSSRAEIVGNLMTVTCNGMPVDVINTDIGFAFDCESDHIYQLVPI